MWSMNIPENVETRHLGRAISFFASLAVDESMWDRIHDLTPEQRFHRLGEISERAVPNPSNPHPQRAEVDMSGEDVWIKTPGGVVFSFVGTGSVSVSFGRDSQFAAGCLSARLWEYTGIERFRVIPKRVISEYIGGLITSSEVITP
jgi:hypothetical protein